ncbi:hypothetical protein Tco_0922059 [Tanacetum coccineum]|uniref:Uncharacterized protein n=1 Tax=Tanacetum coccineum TaxID=301880 RepID=A0ABQ5CX22_9ASTR
MRAPLCARFKDLPTSDMKEILLQCMLEENYDKGHEDHKMAFEALQKSIIRDERASSSTWTSDSAQDSPPPPPSSTTNRGDQSHSSAAPGSSKTTASTTYTTWTTTTSRLKSAASSVPEDILMHEESDFKAQDMGSDDEDSGSRNIPKVSLNQEWFKPLSEEERPVTPEPAWSIPSSCLPVPNNNWASAIASRSAYLLPEKLSAFTDRDIGSGPAYDVVKAFHPDVIHLQFQIEECHKLLTNQVDEGLLSHKGDRLALSITKMKAASYPNAGLEQMLITTSSDTQLVTTEEAIVRILHMRILSVVRIEVFSLYEYDYMKKLVLQRADNQEYTIAESDFKDLYQWENRLEDFQLGIERYQTQLNLTKPRWEAIGLEFMHDYKILDSPWAVVFRDKYGMQMIMHFNEIHKFLNHEIVFDQEQAVFVCYSEEAIAQGIFRNLECFVGVRNTRRVTKDFFRERYESPSSPRTASVGLLTVAVDLLQISLRLLWGSECDMIELGQVKMEMEIPRSSGVNSQPHAHNYVLINEIHDKTE